jgi:streptogramin lyase
MKKQNILSLALKPAMRSVGIGIVLMLAAALIAMITPSAVSTPPPCEEPTATLLVTGLEGATGSTIGPDGALYVTEGAAGRISRVDPQTGEITTFASGLPRAIIGIGGAIDVAFIDNIRVSSRSAALRLLRRCRTPARS